MSKKPKSRKTNKTISPKTKPIKQKIKIKLPPSKYKRVILSGRARYRDRKTGLFVSTKKVKTYQKRRALRSSRVTKRKRLASRSRRYRGISLVPSVETLKHRHTQGRRYSFEVPSVSFLDSDDLIRDLFFKFWKSLLSRVRVTSKSKPDQLIYAGITGVWVVGVDDDDEQEERETTMFSQLYEYREVKANWEILYEWLEEELAEVGEKIGVVSKKTQVMITDFIVSGISFSVIKERAKK